MSEMSEFMASMEASAAPTSMDFKSVMGGNKPPLPAKKPVAIMHPAQAVKRPPLANQGDGALPAVLAGKAGSMPIDLALKDAADDHLDDQFERYN